MSRELMNEPMRSLRHAAADLIEEGVLSASLGDFLAGGLAVSDECVYFADELGKNPHLSRQEMGALGHQCLVNKLHLEDYWEESVSLSWDAWCVAQGVLLGERVLVEAEGLTSLPIDIVVTVDQGGALPPYSNYSTVSFGPDSGDESMPSSTFRFYVHRDGDCWIDDEALDEKMDAVLVMRR